MTSRGAWQRCSTSARENGRPRWAADKLRHFVPFLAWELLASAPALELPPLVRQALADKIASLDLAPTASAADIAAAIDAHYAAFPPDSELVRRVERLFRDVLAEGRDSGASRRFRRFLGQRRTVPTTPVTATEPVTAAGPMARFLLATP